MKSTALLIQQIRACSGVSGILSHAATCVNSLSSSSFPSFAQQGCSHEQASSSKISDAAWSFSHVRYMGGGPHKLSLKRENNKASRAAVRPFLQQQQPTQQHSKMSPRQKPKPIVTAIPQLPQLDEPRQLRKIGKLTAPYAITQQAAFAVVETGGTQFKVTTDDVIYHNKIADVMVNDVVQLGKVMLIGTQQETVIGRPYLPGASVIAAVEETFKDSKVHVFKKKKRKGYSKLHGFRAQLTALRILEFRAPGQQIPGLDSSSNNSISGSEQQQTTLPAADVRVLGPRQQAATSQEASGQQQQQQQQQEGQQQDEQQQPQQEPASS
eukprot:GHUV01009306.1.p1 GENE.GHUV01009306.1~~GHUV01009306.1.p1  ORF type:complete len:325 (+),score=85.82 GHUV01009306.1:256-1230(+)